MKLLILEIFLRVTLFPIYVVGVVIPYLYELVCFYFNQHKINLNKKKNYIILVNPSSGKKQGSMIMDIFREKCPHACVLDIIKSDYMEIIKYKLSKKVPYTVIIAGGDGSCASIIEELSIVDSK